MFILWLQTPLFLMIRGIAYSVCTWPLVYSGCIGDFPWPQFIHIELFCSRRHASLGRSFDAPLPSWVVCCNYRRLLFCLYKRMINSTSRLRTLKQFNQRSFTVMRSWRFKSFPVFGSFLHFLSILYPFLESVRTVFSSLSIFFLFQSRFCTSGRPCFITRWCAKNQKPPHTFYYLLFNLATLLFSLRKV